MSFPLLTTAMVMSQVPRQHAVMVMLKSGEMPSLPVIVGTHGPNDALRVNYEELPGRGTWGLVAFPHGDDRNGVWFTSYSPNQLSAVTSDVNEGAVRYKSHLSGAWEMTAQDGSHTKVYPDGSSMQIGNGGNVPVTYRFTLDASGAQQRVPLTQEERLPNPPATPWPKIFRDGSGAVLSISPTGMITITSASGQLINVGAVGDALYRLIDERIIAYYNAHVHPIPTGFTGVPTVQLTEPQVGTTHLYAG